MTTSRILDVFALCFYQNSALAGSFDKLISARPSSTGYLRSIIEMRARICFNDDNKAITDVAPSEVRKFPSIQNKGVPCPVEDVQKEYELPCMPPWFVHVGSRKLYQALTGILRLVGSSLITVLLFN